MEKEAQKNETKKAKTAQFMEKIAPYRFRVLWTALLLILAILLLTAGFWKTILLLIFAVAGYLFGKMRDEDLDVYSLMDELKTKFGL
ncbi:DUF2273 domain-containing protein [Enterococcus faecalis]